MLGSVSGPVAQGTLTAAQQASFDRALVAAQHAVAAIPQNASFDIQPVLDKLAIAQAREPLLPLGNVWEPLRFRFKKYPDYYGPTPEIEGPVFAVQDPDNRPENAGSDEQWYTLVPQEISVPGIRQTLLKDDPFVKVDDQGQRSAAILEGTLFKKVQPRGWRNQDVVMLEKAESASDPGVDYYVRTEGYAYAPKEIKAKNSTGSDFQEEGNYYKRMDGRIVPNNFLGLAFATYPNFFKRLALLGVETATYSIMYSFFKKARLAYMVKKVTQLGPDIIGGSVPIKSLEQKLRFMPFNPFHTRALPYLAAYMLIAELFRQAEKRINDFSYTKAVLKKAWRVFTTEITVVEPHVAHFVTGIPLSAYPVIEFLTTGRVGMIEKLGELGSVSSLALMGIKPDSFKSKALDMIRRFLIVYFTLQSIDKESTQKFMRVIKKDKGPLLGLLQAVAIKNSDENKAALKKYIESHSALSKHSVLSRILNHGKAKGAVMRLTDAQVLFKHRLKATFLVNTLWILPLLVKGIYTVGAKVVPFAKSLVGA